MATKRKHKNTTRETNKERARGYLSRWGVQNDGGADQERDLLGVIQAAVRQALARNDRRAYERSWVAIAKEQLQKGRSEKEYAELIAAYPPAIKRNDRRGKAGR